MPEPFMPPAFYHAHHGAFAEDLPFWHNLARRTGAPVLALGCGTGRVALSLANEHFAVVGVDYDAAMLRFLQRRNSAVSPVRLIQADFLALPLVSAGFPLAVLPCNTYTTVPTEARHVLLRGVARVLLSGGVFAFSAPNPHVVAALPPHAEPEEEGAFYDNEGLPVQVSTGWERTETTWRVVWHYDRLHPNGRVERTTVVQTHYLAPLSVEIERLHAAGLQVEAQYGDFDATPWRPDAPYWIVVAVRV